MASIGFCEYNNMYGVSQPAGSQKAWVKRQLKSPKSRISFSTTNLSSIIFSPRSAIRRTTAWCHLRSSSQNLLYKIRRVQVCMQDIPFARNKSRAKKAIAFRPAYPLIYPVVLFLSAGMFQMYAEDDPSFTCLLLSFTVFCCLLLSFAVFYSLFCEGHMMNSVCLCVCHSSTVWDSVWVLDR